MDGFLEVVRWISVGFAFERFHTRSPSEEVIRLDERDHRRTRRRSVCGTEEPLAIPDRACQLSGVSSASFRLIGGGVYSLPEAERLTGIPRLRIRRWMEGRSFESRGITRYSPPIIDSALGRDAGQLALTFADLIEVRFLDRFLERGVSWRAVRIAAQRARELLQRPRPFSTRIFKTDGRDILAEIVRPGGVPELLNLVKNQWELERVVTPMLYAGLEFNEFDEAARWWPMTEKKAVVIDPGRAFGTPIVSPGAVPTEILARAVTAEGSQRMVAAIYDIPLRSVRHAVEFETRFLS